MLNSEPAGTSWASLYGPALLAGVLDGVPGAVAVVNPDGVLCGVNQRWKVAAGRWLADVGEGQSVFDIVADRQPEWWSRLRAVLTAVCSGDRSQAAFDVEVATDGAQQWLEVVVSPLVWPEQDDRLGAVVWISDLADRQSVSALVARRGDTDALTGLASRRMLDEVLAAYAGAGVKGMALLVCDIDDFKDLNDTLGYAAGDQALVAIADRIQQVTRSGDVVARFGGDEFVVWCPGLVDPGAAHRTAQRILAALAEPLDLPSGPRTVSASIGLVHSDGLLADPTVLYTRADLAMYAAKTAGKDRVVEFSDQLAIDVDARATTIQRLHRALTADEMELHYQPATRLTDVGADVAAVEALLRWDQPGRGLTLPGEFIGVAEATGLIVPLGRWALGQACADAVELDSLNGFTACEVWVNVSAKQLTNPDFESVIDAALRQSGLHRSRLVIEITEHSAVKNFDVVLPCIQRLVATGIGLSIDDFGTGFSSLSYLQRLPARYVKLDRAFVLALDHDDRAAAVVEGVVGIAHRLGMQVVAEGVETGRQLTQVAGLGCDLIQGFYLGRPQPKDALPAYARQAERMEKVRQALADVKVEGCRHPRR